MDLTISTDAVIAIVTIVINALLTLLTRRMQIKVKNSLPPPPETPIAFPERARLPRPPRARLFYGGKDD
jgi:hypothetical protein